MDLLTGSLVCLRVEEPDTAAEAFSRWGADSEYMRLLTSEYVQLFSRKKLAEWNEKNTERGALESIFFSIRCLADDRLIGFVGLDGNPYPHGDAFVGIGLGSRADWGKGYGRDAMQLILRYAFGELNLRRVSLNTFEYNPRAVASYEKVGFVHEGRIRQYLHREGRRWDLIFMGILREEWESRQVDGTG